ncbi:MAG: DUF4837 family protein [Bacteroidetes bacterium]|nr:DUF4837 family protein [Bacteroidota bacterium]
MFKINKSIAVIFLLALILSCTKQNHINSSGGKCCEILLVTDKYLVESPVGDSLKAFFMQEQSELNQTEPIFTMPFISHAVFDETPMFQTYRNIILLIINDSCKGKIEILKDYKAKPQTIFILKAPNNEAFFHLFMQNKEIIKARFDEMERIRINQAFKENEAKEIRVALLKNFKFSMCFPMGFFIAKKTSDFAWIRLETKEYSQGLLIYSCPYFDKKQLTPQHIIFLRDSLTRQYIPGPTDSSYMITENKITPICREINFKGLYAMETRGLWKLEGDFMGGPFINYTFIDEKNMRIIMLDAYLYSPKKPKRDLLKQLEAIIYTYHAK